MNRPLHHKSRRPGTAWLLFLGLSLSFSQVAQATLSIVTKSNIRDDGSIRSNSVDADFYTITYDATSTGGASLLQLKIDLEGGLDSAAHWDDGNRGYMAYNWGESSGISQGQVTLEDVTNYDNELTIDFSAGYFNPGDTFVFGYDTDGLWYNSNRGGSFGDAEVTVEALWDNGDITYGSFIKDNNANSTAVLDNAVINGNNSGGDTSGGGGSITTAFDARDVTGNRGDVIPFDIDMSENENTSPFYITGLPDGFRLTQGGKIGNRSWIVDYADIGLTNIITPATFLGQLVLGVKQDTSNAITEGADGTFSGGSSNRAAPSSSYTDFSYAGTSSVSSGKAVLCRDGSEGNSGWASIQERSDPGWGYFMVAKATGNEKVLFKETMTLPINSDFRASAFIANITTASMAQIEFRINGDEVVNTGLIDSWDGNGVAHWQEFNASYATSSVNTTVTFEIVSTGNGVIAIDDVVLAAAYSDDMLVTVHDIGKTDSPIYYTFTLTNNHNVPMDSTFTDTLPGGLVWDTDYEIQDEGGLTLPTPVYGNGNTTITLSGLMIPPGTTELSMRTLPPGLTGPGDYTNVGSISVGGEDFIPQTFTADSTFTVAGAN